MSLRIKLLAPLILSIFASAVFAETEIQWWHAMDGTNGERVEKIARDFNASQSEYTVVPTYQGNYTDTMSMAIAAFLTKGHPHIVQVFEVGTATMMTANGVIYPVEQLMKDMDEPFDVGAFLSAVVSYYQTTDGDLLSMPFNSSTPVLWYNKDALDKAGASVPTTWAGVKETAQKLVDSGMSCGFTFGWQSWVMIENFSAWHNLPIGTKENGFAGLGAELTFNNEHVVARLEDIAAMGENHLFVYGGRRGDSLPMFTDGECGMWISSSAYYGMIKEKAAFNFDQSMLPLDTDVTDSPQNTIIGGATLWVLNGHTKEEYKGTAKFLTYLSSPEVQAWWHQETGYVPITTAAYNLSKEQGFYDKHPGTDTAIKQLSLNTPTPNSRGLRFGNFVQIRDVINEELESIWMGKQTAQAAMDEAVKRGNALLLRFKLSVK